MGKLGEKVVADRIQDFGGDLFHHLQFGSIRGLSAVDVLYGSVVKARRCIDEGGDVGWGFWDLKGGFQNVVGGEGVGLPGRCGGDKRPLRVGASVRGWQDLGGFLDGKVRGVGSSSMGVPQGSPLSPVLFLV